MQTTDNIVLITGGSSGIGLALAKKFLSENNSVIITGRNKDRLAKIRAEFPDIRTETADMTNPLMWEQLVKKYSDVNILINNAGIQYNYDFADQNNSPDLIEAELRTNLTGPVFLIKLFLPQLLTQKTAAIINVSSGLGLVPKQSAPVYCATKAGLHIFTKSLRWQLESTNIKVFEIIPPLVDTAMTKGRGAGKISPEKLVDEFWKNFKRDNYEIRIGKVKLLYVINRFFPGLAEKIMRPGL
ncbi:MAG: SDR family NAD(P)-dependent oxidoreductase [Calditrichaeota bacterium]|nr:SDR family NAD(P)-dependent oxidoreductase [Calditrichota bacterium]